MPTNQEWLNQLATESPDKLKAWFDAEHLDFREIDSRGELEGWEVTDKQPDESQDVDSREKLESDALDYLSEVELYGATRIINKPMGETEFVHSDIHEWAKKHIIELLDRQAAITANANKELIEWQAATVARLQKEADTIKAANDDYRDEVGRLQRRNDELRTSYDKLKRERDNLADDLLACNREREQLRKHLGIALDHAHDICSLVDIDGNALDVGD